LPKGDLPWVQLKKSLKKGSLLNYHRVDLLSHEAIHVARMGFQEPFFEECLAYRTSSRRWRRFLGPLFTFSWEPFLFLGVSFVAFFLPSAALFSISIWILSLCLRQLFLNRCISRSSLPFTLCLKDMEIIRLACGFKFSFDLSLRGRLLKLLWCQKEYG